MTDTDIEIISESLASEKDEIRCYFVLAYHIPSDTFFSTVYYITASLKDDPEYDGVSDVAQFAQDHWEALNG